MSGLTLIELLIAMTILALSLGGLYGSFHSGVQIFRRSEDGLGRIQELRVFLMYFRRDLENMVVYEPVPFKASDKEIEFVASVKRYTRRGYVENLHLVRYKIHSDRIVKEEERIQKKAGGGKDKRKLTVFNGIRRGEFAFAYRDEKNQETVWRDVWDPEDKLGIPKYVKLRMQIVSPTKETGAIYVAGTERETVTPAFFEEPFLIPHGRWGTFE